MTLTEAERLMKLARELGVHSLSLDGFTVTFQPTPAQPAISGQPEDIKQTGERMPTDDELLFASAGGLDIEAKPPSEEAA
jgi:hypothetical protein